MTLVGVVAAPFGWLHGEIRKGVVQGILASALLAGSARGNEMFRCRWLDVSELHTRPWRLRLSQTFGAAAARPLTPPSVTIDREVPCLLVRRVRLPATTQPVAGDVANRHHLAPPPPVDCGNLLPLFFPAACCGRCLRPVSPRLHRDGACDYAKIPATGFRYENALRRPERLRPEPPSGHEGA